MLSDLIEAETTTCSAIIELIEILSSFYACCDI